MTKRRGPAAREFDWKIKLLAVALDAPKDQQLLDKLFPPDDFSADRREKELGKIINYRLGKNATDDDQFYQRIRCATKCPALTNDCLKNGSALEVYNRLNPEQTQRVNDSSNNELLNHLFADEQAFPRPAATLPPPSPSTEHYHSHVLGRSFRIFHVSSKYKSPDIDAGIDRADFKQFYLYLDVSASARWHHLTSVPGRYPTFGSCLATLTRLVKDSRWHKLQETQRISTVIIFGAGACSKDITFLDGLAKWRATTLDSHRVSYVLVDTSFHMLLATAVEIDDKQDENYRDFLDLVAVVGDFTELGAIKESLHDHGVPMHREGGRTVFWIPGNTIANIDVEGLISRIEGVSNPGDLLLIGAEFADLTDLRAYKEKVRANYDHDALRDLVLPPVRSYLDKRQIDRTYTELKKMILVTPVQRTPRPIHVKDRVTIEIAAAIPNKGNVVLALSSRYAKDDLERFARNERNFIPLWCIQDNRPPELDGDPQYAQILFERVDGKED